MSTLARFESKINKTGGCWLWLGYVAKDGYGTFSYKQQDSKAHRASYQIYKGNIPKGMFVCHSCDIRHCVNPQHLFLGSHQDNMTDMKNKDRQAKKGHDKSLKLCIEKANEIRDLYFKGIMNHQELAAYYGVARNTIHNVITNKSWK